MAEELKELIEKIQLEGIKAAEDKASAIEAEARKRADEIVAGAKAEASRLVSEAREQIGRLEDGSKSSVKQAVRDAMLSLRSEIALTLERVVAGRVHKALDAEDLARILITIVKGCSGEGKGKIVVSLKKEDMEKVEKALFSELGDAARKGITLKSTADIHGGFLISYDSGKSYFDFSDRALAEYLAARLKAPLGDIVKEAASK